MKKLFCISIAVFFSITVFIISDVFAQGIGVNASGNNPDPSAILDVSSTTKGLLVPRMTTVQRDAISSPAIGLQIFNLDNNCLQFFVGGAWQNIACGCTSAPTAPTGGTQTPSTNQIVWNWTNVLGASGYKYNTTNNYSSAIDNTNNITYSQTGLNCNTFYTLYIWAYNTCGQSTELILTATTTACPFICGTSTIIVNHSTSDGISPVDKTVTYGTVFYDGKCWTDRNLGADNIPGSATDATNAAAGWYWQFNRKQGYAVGPIPSLATTSINENSDFLPANDPCTALLGSPWHIPTQAEWVSAQNTGGWTNYNNVYASALKIHAAGYLDYTIGGGLQSRGNIGTYWSTTQSSNTTAWDIDIQSASTVLYSSNKPYALTLRCIQ